VFSTAAGLLYQQISIGRAAGARSSPAGFGKKIFLSFFQWCPSGGVFGERIFFPKTLPLRPGQQVRCLIKSQRNYAGLT